MEEKEQSDIALTTLEKTGFIVSVIGCLLILAVVAYVWQKQGTKIEAGALEGNLLPPGSVSFLSNLFSGILILCAIVAGFTASVIGFVVSLVSLVGRQTHASILGMVFGVIGPALLLLMFLIINLI